MEYVNKKKKKTCFRKIICILLINHHTVSLLIYIITILYVYIWINFVHGKNYNLGKKNSNCLLREINNCS